MQRLKILALRGTWWALGESFGVATLSFVVFAVLARLLAPQDFGIVALAGVFIVSLNLLIGHSFADCLIQRTEIDRDHLDTVFWTMLAMALLLGLLCWAAAAPMARWLHEPRLAEVLPALALVLPINAVASVQTAMFRREMRFRAITLRSVAGRASGAAVGICHGGRGLRRVEPGRPAIGRRDVDGRGAGRRLALAAASPLLVAASPRPLAIRLLRLDQPGGQRCRRAGRQPARGRAFRIGDARLFHHCLAYGAAHPDADRERRLSCRSQRLRAASGGPRGRRASPPQSDAAQLSIRIPIGVGMAMLAAPLVRVMFGDHWQPSIPLLAILALDMIPAFYAIFFSACYRAMGRADWVLGLSLAYVGTGILAIWALMPFGIQVVAIAWVAKSILLLPVQLVLLEPPARGSAAPSGDAAARAARRQHTYGGRRRGRAMGSRQPPSGTSCCSRSRSRRARSPISRRSH